MFHRAYNPHHHAINLNRVTNTSLERPFSGIKDSRFNLKRIKRVEITLQNGENTQNNSKTEEKKTNLQNREKNNLQNGEKTNLKKKPTSKTEKKPTSKKTTSKTENRKPRFCRRPTLV